MRIYVPHNGTLLVCLNYHTIMSNQHRTHIIIPFELVAEIDSLVGKRGRSRFLTEAARRELQRLRLDQALDKAVGIWKDKDHPELKNGSANWVTQLRKAEASRTLSGRIGKKR